MGPDQLNRILLEQIKKQNALIADQADRIAALEAELREWKSGAAGPTNRQRRRVRGAKPAKDQPDPNKKRPAGRKKGHKGSGRKKPKTVDVVESRRLDSCPDCSGNLIDKGVGHRHLVEDIVLTVKTTQYDLHRHHCPACQTDHQAPLPQHLGGPVRIGPSALALAAWMRLDMRQSIGNIARFFTEGIGLSWSKGSISQRLCGLMETLEPVTEKLWEDLQDQPVVHVDETGWREDGFRRWMWNGSGQNTSCFHITEGRDRESFEEVIRSSFPGIVVTDGYTAYHGIPADQHAGCWAHILRKARDAWEVHQEPADHAVLVSIKRFLRGARWYRASHPDDLASQRPFLLKAFDEIVRVSGLASTPRLVKQGRWLSKRRSRYLLFLNHDAVPLTNNQAERELRGAVIMRRTSFGGRNHRGNRTLADGMTIIRSLAKRGASWFEFIPRALQQLAQGELPVIGPLPAGCR